MPPIRQRQDPQEIRVRQPTSFLFGEGKAAHSRTWPALHSPVPIPTPRAVLMDLDGTLYHQKPLRRRMLRMLLTHCATHPLSARRLLRILRTFRITREGLRDERPPGMPLEEAQYSVPADQLGVPSQTVRDTVGSWMHERPLPHLKRCVRSDVTAFLDSMDASDIRCGVFSDYPALKKLEWMGLADRFDPIFGATDASIDAFKPSPEGYQQACRTWGLSADECLYVGDRDSVDAAGAEAAGMPCVILGTGLDRPGVWFKASLKNLKDDLSL